MRRVKCKGCGRAIVFAIKEDGRSVPLDPSAPVYEVSEAGGVVSATRTQTAMVSHFATCSSANLFSGRSRKNVKGKKQGEQARTGDSD